MKSAANAVRYIALGFVLAVVGWNIGQSLEFSSLNDGPQPVGIVIGWFVALVMLIGGSLCLYGGLRLLKVRVATLIMVAAAIIALIGFHADIIVVVLATALMLLMLIHDVLTS